MIWFVAWEPEEAWITETLRLPSMLLKSEEKSWQNEVDLHWAVTCLLQMRVHLILSNILRLYVRVHVCVVWCFAVSSRKQLCDQIYTCSWHLTHDYYKWDTHLIASNSFQMDSQIWDNSETSALFKLLYSTSLYFLIDKVKIDLIFCWPIRFKYWIWHWIL